MRSVFALVLILATRFASAQYTHKDFLPLKELAGTWVIEYEDYSMFEVWEVIDTDTLVAMSFQVRDGDTLFTEVIELIYTDHQIIYKPRVFYQNEGEAIPFLLSGYRRKTFVFENPDHDFPRRITYILRKKEELEVVIEGDYRGGHRKVPFLFRRLI